MAKSLQSGATLVEFDALDSTSLEAKRRAEAGARGPLWILARQQTQGYGRRGTEWRSDVGDLAATFLFDPGAPAERLGELSFVVSLAVADVLEASAPKAAVRLKWPNDVLIDGGKVCGVLLELIAGRQPDAPLLAIGIGVNITSKPDVAQYPTVRLVDVTASPPEPSKLVALIDARLDERITAWRNSGFEPVRRAWLEQASGVGAPARVQLPAETVEGVIMDLDPSGALVLDCGGVERRITAGAVLRS